MPDLGRGEGMVKPGKAFPILQHIPHPVIFGRRFVESRHLCFGYGVSRAGHRGRGAQSSDRHADEAAFVNARSLCSQTARQDSTGYRQEPRLPIPSSRASQTRAASTSILRSYRRRSAARDKLASSHRGPAHHGNAVSLNSADGSRCAEPRGLRLPSAVKIEPFSAMALFISLSLLPVIVPLDAPSQP